MRKGLIIALPLLIGAGAVAWQLQSSRMPEETQEKSKPTATQSPLAVEKALFRGDLNAQKPLAEAVIRDIQQGIKPELFKTGNARFDGEWTIGTYQMAVMGLGQMILAHPELRKTYLPKINQCIEQLLKPDAIAFGTQAYNENGLDALDSSEGHAYIGYVDLALSMYRLLKADNRFAGMSDRLIQP